MFPIDNEQKQKDLNWARNYAKNHRWTFAKTYAKTTPHEYLVCRKGMYGRKDFERFCEIFFKYCVEEKFFGHPQKYLYLDDGYKYFTDGDFLINRADARISYGKQD